MARILLSGTGGRWPAWTVAVLLSLVVALPIAVTWAGGFDKAAKRAAELGSRLTPTALQAQLSAAAHTASCECRCEDACDRQASVSSKHAAENLETGEPAAALAPAPAAAGPPAAATEVEPGGGGSGAGKSNSSAGGSGEGCGAGAPPPQGWRSSPHAASTNYTPSLSPRELEKGIVSYGEGSRARRWAHKLLSGQPVSVALLGGSITQGTGSDPPHTGAYALRVLRWINETFPNPRHVLRNNGHGAVPSSYFSMCVSREVPQDADLVILEFNMNDGGPLGSPMRRAHERLVRKILNLPNRPAAVELVFWEWPALPFNASQLPVPWRHSHDEDLGDIAQYYRLPWLGLRSLLWDGLSVTRPGPEEGAQFGRFDNFFLVTDGVQDNKHPNDGGHRVMADLVIHWMQRVLQDVAVHPLEAWDEEEAARPLPIPMQQNNWEAASSNTCLMGEEITTVVTAHDDAWQWVDEGKPGRPPKWGWVSTQPGSSLQLTLNTSKPGAAPGEKVTLGVAHLKSYEASGSTGQYSLQGSCMCFAVFPSASGALCTPRGCSPCRSLDAGGHLVPLLPTAAAWCCCRPLALCDPRPSPKHAPQHMGKFSVTCLEGCACDPLTGDGHGADKWSQLNFAMLLVTPADACKLELTVLNDTQLGEHKVKLLGVVLSEETGFLISEEKNKVMSDVMHEAWDTRWDKR